MALGRSFQEDHWGGNTGGGTGEGLRPPAPLATVLTQRPGGAGLQYVQGAGGDLATMADPGAAWPGRRGLRSTPAAHGAHRVGLGLAQSQPAGPRGRGASASVPGAGVSVGSASPLSGPEHETPSKRTRGAPTARLPGNGNPGCIAVRGENVTRNRSILWPGGRRAALPSQGPADPQLGPGPGQPCPPSPEGPPRSPCRLLSRRPGLPHGAETLS